MSRSRRAKAAQDAKRRYLKWVLGIALAAILVATGVTIGIIASQDNDTGSSSISNPSEIPRISVGEVKARLDAGSNIVIVDNRSERSYEISHIAGAIFMPVGEIAQRYGELSGYDEIVTYCA